MHVCLHVMTYACNYQGRIQDFRKGGGAGPKIRWAQPKISGGHKDIFTLKRPENHKQNSQKGGTYPYAPAKSATDEILHIDSCSIDFYVCPPASQLRDSYCNQSG
jgi:hypothetical protein